EVDPPTGQAGSELERRALNRRAGLGVEGVDHLVELHAPPRVDERELPALVQRAAVPARNELEVLEPERRSRADRELGVVAQRLDGLVELQRDHGVRRVRADLAGDAVDRPYALAADANLVALDEARGVRHLGLDVVGRDERQARVRVVGEEHRDDRDQHGHGADQDRRARDAWLRTSAHGGSSQLRRLPGLGTGGACVPGMLCAADWAACCASRRSLRRSAGVRLSQAPIATPAVPPPAGAPAAALPPFFGAPFPTPLKWAEQPAVGVVAYVLHVPPSWYDGSTCEIWSKRPVAATESHTKRPISSGTPRASSESTRPFTSATAGGSVRETGPGRSASGWVSRTACS